MKKYITIFTIILLFKGVALANELPAKDICYSSPYALIKAHNNIFVPGSFSLVRTSTDNSVEALLVRDISSSKSLKEIGVKAGTEIIEICGKTVASIFKSSSENLVCCNSKYPNYLTLKLKNSLIETYEVDLKLNF